MNDPDPIKTAKELLLQLNQEQNSKAADLRVKYLGKNGLFKDLSARIKDVPVDQKKIFGQELNKLKTKIEETE